MTRPPRKSRTADSNRFDLDSWLFSSAELETGVRLLLSAYRDAAEEIRRVSASPGTPAEPVKDAESGDETSDIEGSDGRSRGLPPVLRLHEVAGIEESELSSLHGQLLANGYLSVEILGRSDGLAYRLTRDGLRQLSGETAMSDAA